MSDAAPEKMAKPTKETATEQSIPAGEGDDFSKHSSRGIHSLTQSVTDEASRPMSEVDDDEADSCASSSVRESRDESEDLAGSEQDGGTGIESEGIRGSRADGSRKPRAGSERAGEDGQLRASTPSMPDDEARQESDSDEEISSSSSSSGDVKDPELENSDSGVTTEPAVAHSGGDGEDSAQRPEGLEWAADDLEISSAVNQVSMLKSYSLEDRIRKAREYQDLSQELQADSFSGVRNLTEVLGQNPSLELQGAEERALVSPLPVQVVERRPAPEVSTASSEGGERSSGAKTGAGEAFLVGVIASGVNKPTWVAVRVVLVALVASLLVLMHVAVQSDSWFVIANVLCLIVIAGGLILLLSWFVSMTGLVSVDKQMEELYQPGVSSKVKSKMA